MHGWATSGAGDLPAELCRGRAEVFDKILLREGVAIVFKQRLCWCHDEEVVNSDGSEGWDGSRVLDIEAGVRVRWGEVVFAEVEVETCIVNVAVWFGVINIEAELSDWARGWANGGSARDMFLT